MEIEITVAAENASKPTPNKLPPLSAAQLAESEAIIEEGEADIAVGKTRELRAGLLEIGRGLGFDLDGVDIGE